jgi:hypothetical protein
VADREATLDEVYGWFREDVAAAFSFLADEYALRPTSARDEGRDGIFTRFRGDVLAVEVGYEPADDAVEVFLIRFEDGRIPAYLDAWQRNWVPLSRYLERAGHGGAEGPQTVPWGDRDALREVLWRHAEALRVHGDAVLRGDFSVFDAAEPPPITEDQLYDVGEPPPRPRSLPWQLGAWAVRRAGRLVRRT